MGAQDTSGVENILPHIFGVQESELGGPLDATWALAKMQRHFGTGVHRIYEANAAGYINDADKELYSVGFALTVMGIERALQARGERLPHVSGDQETVQIYRGVTGALHEDMRSQAAARLALYHGEPALLEAVDDAYPVADAETVPYFDGMVDAYSVLAHAAVAAAVLINVDIDGSLD